MTEQPLDNFEQNAATVAGGSHQQQGPAVETHQPQTLIASSVPKTSALYGVSVQAWAFGPTEEKTGILWFLSFVHARGVVITDVKQGTPAAQLGLRSGDFIMSVVNGGERTSELLLEDVATECAEDFYRLASKCVPDCLIGLVISKLNGPFNKHPDGFIHVGTVKNNFKSLQGQSSKLLLGYIGRDGILYAAIPFNAASEEEHTTSFAAGKFVVVETQTFVPHPGYLPLNLTQPMPVSQPKAPSN